MQRALRQRGLTLIESLVVISIILVILVMATPLYKKQLMLSHETAAIRAIQAIQVAEAQYMVQFGTFASLTQLGPPASGAPGPNASELLPQGLASGRDSGYDFAVVAHPGNYVVNATPEVFNSTGRFTFYSDDSLVIRRNSNQELATTASPQIR